jgi:hypothetical protein
MVNALPWSPWQKICDMAKSQSVVLSSQTASTLKGIDAILRSKNEQSLQLPYRC